MLSRLFFLLSKISDIQRGKKIQFKIFIFKKIKLMRFSLDNYGTIYLTF